MSQGVLPAKRNILQLYKKILRNAALFPSIRRWHIYQAVREEFREHAVETDESKISQYVQSAEQGLKYLTSYNSLDTKNATSMEVNLTGSTQAPVVKNVYDNGDTRQSSSTSIKREKF